MTVPLNSPQAHSPSCRPPLIAMTAAATLKEVPTPACVCAQRLPSLWSVCMCVCEQTEQVRDRQIMIAMDFLLSFARPALRNCCLELVRRLIDELRREKKLPTPRHRLKEKQKNSSPLPFVPRCPDCSWHASITCRASDSYRVHPGRQESWTPLLASSSTPVLVIGANGGTDEEEEGSVGSKM